MYQLDHNTPYAGVHNIKVMLGNININMNMRYFVKRASPTSPISGLTNLEKQKQKQMWRIPQVCHKSYQSILMTTTQQFSEFLGLNRGCFSLWSTCSCSTCAVWLKYCSVYPSRSHDSTNPPRKSLSGHPFVWLSKTDKKFSFCAPERLCPLEIFL